MSTSTHADFVAAAVVIAASTVPLMGLGIFIAILPLLSPEKGEQMTFAVQGILLLVSGVYYPITVLPGVFQVIGHASPLTYTLEGVRDALINHGSCHRPAAQDRHPAGDGRGADRRRPGRLLGAERRAKRMGLLKRNG